MSGNIRKCKSCKGTGILYQSVENTGILTKSCPICEGTGVPLVTTIEEQYHDASEVDGTQLYQGDSGFIEFEEDDYEV